MVLVERTSLDVSSSSFIWVHRSQGARRTILCHGVHKEVQIQHFSSVLNSLIDDPDVQWLRISISGGTPFALIKPVQRTPVWKSNLHSRSQPTCLSPPRDQLHHMWMGSFISHRLRADPILEYIGDDLDY